MYSENLFLVVRLLNLVPDELKLIRLQRNIINMRPTNSAVRRFILLLLPFILLLVFLNSELFGQSGFQNPDIDFTANELALQPDSKILVAGEFSTVAGQARTNVARLNPNGSLDTSFGNPNISDGGSRANVFSIAQQSDGKILINGLFTSVGGSPRLGVARLNSDGTVDSSYLPNVNSTVSTLAIQPDGKHLIGGYFTTVGGQTRNHVARLNTDGSLDSTFSDPLIVGIFNVTVPTISVQPDGKILISGNFSSVSGQPRNGVARLNSDGSLDTTFELSLVGSVTQFIFQNDNKIMICGFFPAVNGVPRTAVARINLDGTLDSSFQNINIPSGNVVAMGLQTDGKIVVGGEFSIIAGQTREDFARINSNGTFDASFQDVNANFGGSFGSLNSIVIQPDGKILVGGYFTEIGRQPRRMVVRLISDGTLDLPPAETFTVNKVADTNDGVCNSDCSLREAVAAVNALPEPSLITFDAVLFSSPQAITLTLGELLIADNRRVSVVGSGPNLVTVSGNQSSRILKISRDANVTISGITLTNGNGFGTDVFNEGGAIYISPNGVASQLTLNNVIISNSQAGTGGGIRSSGSSIINITDSTISGNTASGNLGGGGVYFDNGTLNVTNSTIINNVASFSLGSNGGIGIGNSSCIFNLTNSNVVNNSAAFSGGVGAGGTTTITNTVFSNNNAIKSGGGLRASGNVTVIDSLFNGNSVSEANGSGGGVNNFGRLTMTNTVVSNNSAPFGGGIFTSGGLSLSGSTVSNNTSGGGGGIYNNAGGPTSLPVSIQNSTVSGNVVTGFGGGIYNRDLMNVTNSTVKSNIAALGGGGLFNVFLNSGSPILSVSNCTFTDNTTAAAGGGLANQGGIFNLTNSTISGNLAGNGGGISTNSGGAVNFIHSTVANNTSRSTSAGGVNNSGTTVNARNTIFASNRTLSSQSHADFNGAVTSQGYNLFGTTVNTTISGSTTGNLLGFNPRLSLLKDNGGPTWTHGLRKDSPAIDAGSEVSNLLVDQRGMTRPVDFVSIPNSPGGNASDIGAFEYQFSDSIPSTAFVDFDGDGKTDVSIFRPSVGEWWYLRSSDSSNGAFRFGSSTDRIVPADYTGDGKTDVAFWRESSGEWFILRSEDGSFYSFTFGTTGDIPVPADFDGDGKADPAIFRPSNATWFILKSSGGTTIQQFGTTGDLPVSGDYDGDGKSDLAIFRPSNGQWWLNRSSNQTTNVFSFGTSSDKAVPADYTGDGKTDVAFFRPSSGEWFILRSEDSSFYSFPFGQTGDAPTPGDYDGDGKADPAVFRNSKTTWYKLQSTSGFEALGFGLNGDLPVPGAFVR
jgi:uncharacterized delta-60 repeat protein/CSLREA domain-containing protein